MYNPSNIALCVRFNSSNSKITKSTNTTHKVSTPPPAPPASTPPLPESFHKTIPGETEQLNTIRSRLPTFPLRNKSTLLPKPGVPTSANTRLRTMMEILDKKRAPELIYEAEPHQTYFLICGALAVIFTVYGLTFIDWGFRTVWELYLEDNDLTMLVGRFGMCLAITGVALGVLWMALSFPTRLIRRIWIIPGKQRGQKFVKFTTHPMLPNRATPVYTVPLENLVRSHKSKVFTRNGIYGTLDRSTFFFLLKEKEKKFGYWIVDRNGWFWGDGRVFDILFGKESIEEASKGQSYDEKLKEASEKLKEERQKLKDEEGPMWQIKTTKKMIKADAKKMMEFISEAKKGSNNELPPKDK